jgi:hypothetical protein
VFDVVKYDGNNSTQSITSLAFEPDFVWSKCRNVGRSHRLNDAVRGSTKELYSDATSSEFSDGSIVAFTSNGFNLDNATGSTYNTSGETYVSWCWDAGTSTVTNNSGSISSQVRANPTAGFSVVTYEPTSTWTSNANATVGHGLGVKPALIIAKNTERSVYWSVYHSALGAAPWLRLNTTNAAVTTTVWGNPAVEPTSTVFTFGDDASVGYWANEKIVAYCFSPVVGYSAALSWTGNGSNDGTMIYCGFSPRFWIWKRTDSTGDWWMIDTARSNTGNPVDEWLAANRSDAEYPNDGDFDFLSNGIKIRTTSTSVNASGGSYIGFAWASNPFQYARAQ